MNKYLIQVATIYASLSVAERLWQWIRAVDGPVGPHDGGPGSPWAKVITAGVAAGLHNVLQKQTASHDARA